MASLDFRPHFCSNWIHAGLASYYRQNIPDIAWPLHHLTQKDVMFTRGATQADAFETLKKALIEAPVLSYPKFDTNVCFAN